MLYNLYNTWSATTLNIQYDSSVPLSSFPNSILSMTSLQYLTFSASNRLIADSSTLTINLAFLHSLSVLQIDSFPLGDMNYPIFTFASASKVTGLIINCVLDFQDLNLFAFYSLYMTSCVFMSNLPTGNYSTMNVVSITDSISYTGPIPESACAANQLAVSGSGITSLPSCVICEWGNPAIINQFNNNPSLIQNLNGVVRSCPNFDITSTTPTIPTIGGKMDVKGVDLGWLIYNDQNVEYPSAQLVIANEYFKVPIPPGSGIDKTVAFKFHYAANPSTPVIVVTFSYSPPTLTSMQPSGQNIVKFGENFCTDSSLIQVYFAGILTELDIVDYSYITTKTNVLPYEYNLIVNVKVVIDGQSVEQVFKPTDVFATVLNQTFPVLYSGGGYAEFTGVYLTYDTTIMNLTINGILFSSNIVESSSTKYIIKYDPIPVGSYPLLFNQLDYQLSGTIQVTSQPPCQVVHGYCYGSIVKCYPPYIGPDCSSIPANLTRIPFNTSQPVIQTPNTFQTVWKGEVYNFKFSISPKSLQELDSSGNLVANYLPTVITTQNLTEPYSSLFSYQGAPQNGNTADVYNIIRWYPEYYTDTNALNENVVELPSSYRYQNALTHYNFVSPSNLECSNSILKWLILQLPYVLELIYKNTVVGTELDQPLNYTISTISQLSQSINQEFTAFIQPWASGTFVYEFDFTVLFDETSASSEQTAICNNFTPAPTTPSVKPCPGTPACGGPSQGTCVNSQCHCTPPWKGYQCDSKDDTLPPIDNPDTSKPTITQTKDDIAVHISIVSIRELDFSGSLVREESLSNWVFSQDKSDKKQTFQYQNSPFGTSIDNTKIHVTVDYFYKDSQVEFAGQSFSKSTGSYKYSANITNWPFLKKTNQLQIVFLSGASDNQDSDNSCTVKNIAYSQDVNGDLEDNVEIVYIQVNGQTFQNKFINLAIVDGMIRQINNIQLPTTEDDSNTQSNSLVGVLTPYHENFVVIDPDFSLLVSTVPADEKEGSICSSNSKSSGLTKSQLAGIIVASAIVFICIIVLLSYFVLAKNLRAKILFHDIKSKITLKSR
ncbi:hypothetical protein DLAC_05000 [Tieghemostelium lacteum]|uniref:EGF-like domain-containing protein n=1 Tax=Tieghemostelium lacteum TaxID=361077 RepID=A0A151ZI95_TIELA|nr:hypothetical protein DLAC_05000 [Tieghemostelium lacteum]|eukprot:KYQ93619.1 hypothetical protein DLAC_05000 [Tieghemostelium lacteum]